MVRAFAILALVLAVFPTLATPQVVEAKPDRRCFNALGIVNCIEGRFREFWEQNGGLSVFGYPLTPATQQSTANGTFLTQLFERSRFEYHPEQARPYDVLLSQLGVERLAQQHQDWTTLPKAQPGTSHYFVETGHAIAHPAFWTYWTSHGLAFDTSKGFSFAESLALFGYPISEPQIETNPSGDRVLTQWFERARFEDHGTQGVLLGLLGTEGNLVTSRILQIGFGQQGRYVSSAFIIENTNPTQPLRNFVYHVTARDTSGSAVATIANSSPLIYPGERVGFTDILELDRNVRVAYITLDTQSTAPLGGAAQPTGPLYSASTTFVSGSQPKVTGTIGNHSGESIHNLRVSAIAYNSSGAIIGGGMIEVAVVPGNGQIGVSVPLVISQVPARVELFAAQTSRSFVSG